MFSSTIQVVCFGLKISLSICIIALIFSSTVVYRNEFSSTSTFNVSFRSITVLVRHLFCDLPKQDDVSADDIYIMDALNVPNGTYVPEELEAFGLCLLTLEIEEKQTANLCSCKKRLPYVSLAISASTGILAEIVRYCIWITHQKRYRDEVVVLKSAVWIQAVVGIVWLSSTIWAIVYHFTWPDTITLPNSVPRNYFAIPGKWSLAVFLSSFVCLCYIFEFLYLRKMKRRVGVWQSLSDDQVLIELQPRSTEGESELFSAQSIRWLDLRDDVY